MKNGGEQRVRLEAAFKEAVREVTRAADAKLGEVARGLGITETNAHEWIAGSTYDGIRLVRWFQRKDDPRTGPHGTCVVMSALDGFTYRLSIEEYA